MARSLGRVWNTFATLIGLAILVILVGNCVSCFALPSYIHQSSASYIYEWTYNSRFAAHPTDRSIAQAASCLGYFGSKDFVSETNGVKPFGWRYDSRTRAALWLAELNAPEQFLTWMVSDSELDQRSYRRRRGGIGRAILDSGLVLSRHEATTARWLRAAHRTGGLNLDGLTAQVKAQC